MTEPDAGPGITIVTLALPGGAHHTKRLCPVTTEKEEKSDDQHENRRFDEYPSLLGGHQLLAGEKNLLKLEDEHGDSRPIVH